MKIKKEPFQQYLKRALFNLSYIWITLSLKVSSH